MTRDEAIELLRRLLHSRDRARQLCELSQACDRLGLDWGGHLDAATEENRKADALTRQAIDAMTGVKT